jgi:hypothetical protein
MEFDMDIVDYRIGQLLNSLDIDKMISFVETEVRGLISVALSHKEKDWMTIICLSFLALWVVAVIVIPVFSGLRLQVRNSWVILSCGGTVTFSFAKGT